MTSQPRCRHSPVIVRTVLEGPAHHQRTRRGDHPWPVCAELVSRYDLEHLEEHVLGSQRSRQLVADALKVGRARHWDFDPEPEHGYVRGDFWSAFRFGKIPAAD